MADAVIEPAAVGEIEAVNTDERRNLLAEQLDKAEVVETPEPVVETAEEKAAKVDAAGRVHGPDGKFAPKAADKPAEGAIQAAPTEEPAWKKPVQSWKKEYHEHWTKLDPKVQEYIHQRESEMRAGVEQSIPKIRAYDQIAKVIQPFMQNVQVAAGGDVPKAIHGLMEADHILRHSPPEQKKAYLYKLAQAYGIPLGDTSDAPQVSPEIFQVRQELAAMKAERDAERKAKEDAEQTALLSDIQKFSSTHEHYEAAKPTMIQLLQSGVAMDLEDAYEKAIRLNDDLFKSQQAAQQAAAEAERIKTKDGAAKAARSAAVSVRTSTPGSNTAPKAQDRRSMLAEQLDSIGDRL